MLTSVMWTRRHWSTPVERPSIGRRCRSIPTS